MDILNCLRRIEERGPLETAHRAKQTCGDRIFRYAIATDRCEQKLIPNLKGAVPPVKPKHHAEITDPAKIGELLRTIDGYEGAFVAKCALKLAPLFFVRPGELRNAQ